MDSSCYAAAPDEPSYSPCSPLSPSAHCPLTIVSTLSTNLSPSQSASDASPVLAAFLAAMASFCMRTSSVCVVM